MGGEEINTSHQVALANKTKQITMLLLLFRIPEFRNPSEEKDQSGKKGQEFLLWHSCERLSPGRDASLELPFFVTDQPTRMCQGTAVETGSPLGGSCTDNMDMRTEPRFLWKHFMNGRCQILGCL